MYAQSMPETKGTNAPQAKTRGTPRGNKKAKAAYREYAETVEIPALSGRLYKYVVYRYNIEYTGFIDKKRNYKSYVRHSCNNV
jgi:hypothetical protein